MQVKGFAHQPWLDEVANGKLNQSRDRNGGHLGGHREFRAQEHHGQRQEDGDGRSDGGNEVEHEGEEPKGHSKLHTK